MLDSKQTKRNC